MTLDVISEAVNTPTKIALTNDEIIDPSRSTAALAHRVLQSYGVNWLLTHTNPKTEKNAKFGYHTAILHLAPGNLSGHEVCPARTAGCTNSCLNTAGNPVFLKAKQKARIARTKFLFEQPDLFKALLVAEIGRHVKKSRKLRLKPCMRLNGTSDIAWEIKFPMLFVKFRSVQMYDYSKIIHRMLPGWKLPPNYHLTFSRSESNWDDCEKILQAGGTVTAVFAGYGRSAHPHPFPEKLLGWPTIDGDRDDMRFADKPGHLVALRAKGLAVKDYSGFVVR